MNKFEKPENQEEQFSEKILGDFYNLVNEVYQIELDTLKKDKEALVIKLEAVHKMVEDKKLELERALEEKVSSDRIQILFAEFQQKNLALRDLEISLIALQTVLDKKS